MPRPLHRMFSTVPQRYDILNRTLTLGMDQLWRRRAARICLEGNPRTILDLCTGTGDMAAILEDHARVVGADFVAPMLEVARRKARRARFVLADAAALPFPDASLDRVTIAFGFRNLTYRNASREAYLAEIHRVIAPGGRFVIVETSQPRSAVLRSGFHAYMRGMVEPVGGLVSGRRPAYRYLARSAAGFYRPEEVTAMLEDVGFAEVSFRPLMAGVAGIHVATR